MGFFEEQERLGLGNVMGPATPVMQPNGTAAPTMLSQGAASPVLETDGADEEKFQALCEKYKADGMQGKMYIVTTNLSQDDDMDRTLSFLFKEPKAASYDRYVKTANVSSSKAMRTFVLDNICPEQKNALERQLAAYPAMGISLGEKLLYMLGLSKTTTVKRL